MQIRIPPVQRPQCGTYGGYQTHGRNNEDKCEPCKAASREYANNHHKKRKEQNPDYRVERDKAYSKKYAATHKYNKNLATNPIVTREQCGTFAGSRWHARRAEVMCEPCRLALRAYNKARLDSDPEKRQKHRETNKASREKHKDKLRAKSKEYREANREILSTKNRKYHYDNPEKTRQKARLRRARIRGNGFEYYTESQVLDLYGTICYLCNTQIDLTASRYQGHSKGWELGLHIDHVIPIVGGGPDTLENVRPTHAQCNLKKNAKHIGVIMTEETFEPTLDADLFDEEIDAEVEVAEDYNSDEDELEEDTDEKDDSEEDDAE